MGVDGRLSPARIAEVIASCNADIVALQELDVGRARTGGVDQAHAIAEELGMHMHFHPAFRVLEESYGDAVLTARPSRLVKAGPLPTWGRRSFAGPFATWSRERAPASLRSPSDLGRAAQRAALTYQPPRRKAG